MRNKESMKAIVCTRYGKPKHLKYMDVKMPFPAKDEILIRIHASTVTAADTMMRRAQPFISRFFLGFFRPKAQITGTGLCGTIIKLGSEVTRFKVGDMVFGESGMKFGTNAEYITLNVDSAIALKPHFLSVNDAATITDGPVTSLNFLTQVTKVKKGDKILINGASGSLGTAAVQLAKYFGANVTAVCSFRNVDLIKSLGADIVIDYTKTDFTKSRSKYDIVFDTIGRRSFVECKKILNDNGVYMSPVISLGLLFNMLLTRKSDAKKALFSATGMKSNEELKGFLSEIIKIIETGELKIITDRTYPLEACAEAHSFVDSGRKVGNVIIVHPKEQSQMQ